MTRTFRVLVCGGRAKSDPVAIEAVLHRLLREHGHLLEIIHGGCEGIDADAHEWAQWNDVHVRVYKADWANFGKAAGPIRNQRMLDEGRPDLVLAYPGGAGTRDMVRKAEAAGVRVVGIAPSGSEP